MVFIIMGKAKNPVVMHFLCVLLIGCKNASLNILGNGCCVLGSL
jgi:hypothetical protein